MVTSYPHFYLLSDLDPEKDTTHGLIDFLSHVQGEFQVAYWNLDKWLPFDKKYSVWEVEVDGDRISYSTNNSTNGDTYPYRGLFTTRFLPSLGDYHTWKKLENEIEIVPAEQSWSWHINSKLFQSCTITMRPLTPFPEEEKEVEPASEDPAEEEEPAEDAVCDPEDMKGIRIDGKPITYFDISQKEGHAGLSVELGVDFSEVHELDGEALDIKKSKRVVLPALEEGAWEKAISQGHMKISVNDNGVDLDLQTMVVSADADGSQLSALIVHQALRAIIQGNNDAAVHRFLELMADNSYSLTVSGAPALRGAIHDDSIFVYRIYVQDEGKVTTYLVPDTLSCNFCEEDGQFRCYTDNNDDCLIFKVGVHEEDPAVVCEPVIVIFKKI